MKQPLASHGCHRLRGVLLALLLLGLAVPAGFVAAAEVYTWTDENGVVHFSQLPNAAGQSKEIDAGPIYEPGSGDTPATPAPPPASEQPADATAESSDTAPQLSYAEQRRQQIAERRQKQHEEQAETARLCAQHRKRIEQLEPARRVFYTDDQGNQVRLDDDERLALIEQSQAFVGANCPD